MSLGKRKGGSGDITPLLKFDARNGIFYRCDRVREIDGTWSNEQKNITDGMMAVFDMATIEVGWISFSSGGPPSFVSRVPSKYVRSSLTVSFYRFKLSRCAAGAVDNNRT